MQHVHDKIKNQRLILWAIFLPVFFTACSNPSDSSPPGANQGGTQQTPTSCVAEVTPVVNESLAKASAIRGGQFYDKWWAVKVSTTATPSPVTDHPVWEFRQANPTTQLKNNRTGSATWRCEECHGWDYKGVDGAYGAGSHYTGFPGLVGVNSKDPVELFCAIRAGTAKFPTHQFNSQNSSGFFINDRIWDLVKFITDKTEAGIIATEKYIDNNTGSILSADTTNGVALYTAQNSCSNDQCHGPDGKLRIDNGNTTLGTLADTDPWEVFHKIRYGHPGSLMPSFIERGLGNDQIKDVIAYVRQSLPEGGGGGGGGGTPDCTSTYNNFVTANLAGASAAKGGLLYDAWWTALGVITAPVSGDHPVWANRATNPSNGSFVNTRNGAVTWQCNECHGWDYRGANGSYNQSSNHYTGFPGLITAKTKDPVSLFCAIREGTINFPNHKFNSENTSGVLQDSVLLDLVKFITDASQGVIDTSSAIDANGIAIGSASAGTTIYNNVSGCGNASCHGIDGTLNADGGTLGLHADEEPWEFLHKVRYGSPGSTMPSFVDKMELAAIADVLKHAQYVLQPGGSTGGGGGGGGGDPIRGGQLYDKWWAVKGIAAPGTLNPILAVLQQNDPSIPSPADPSESWRCVLCHGWHYEGDSISNLKGLFNVDTGGMLVAKATLTDAQLVGEITNGQGGLHKFVDTGKLTQEDVLDLVAFIQQQTIDTDEYIFDTTRAVKVHPSVDVTRGPYLYNEIQSPPNPIKGICVNCHGVDGSARPAGAADNVVIIPLGTLAKQNPWRVLHTIRFGAPGTVMPSLQPSLPLGDAVSVLQFVQTLP